jgi:hypothetical protein
MAGRPLRVENHVDVARITAMVLLTLALGIGANTAIFSVVNATLLRPLPFHDPEQLVVSHADLRGLGAQSAGFSVPELDDLRDRAGVFSAVSAVYQGPGNLTGGEHPERLETGVVLEGRDAGDRGVSKRRDLHACTYPWRWHLQGIRGSNQGGSRDRARRRERRSFFHASWWAREMRAILIVTTAEQHLTRRAPFDNPDKTHDNLSVFNNSFPLSASAPEAGDRSRPLCDQIDSYPSNRCARTHRGAAPCWTPESRCSVLN